MLSGAMRALRVHVHLDHNGLCIRSKKSGGKRNRKAKGSKVETFARRSSLTGTPRPALALLGSRCSARRDPPRTRFLAGAGADVQTDGRFGQCSLIWHLLHTRLLQPGRLLQQVSVDWRGKPVSLSG